MNILKNKIRQHNVWQEYLSPWLTDKKILCLLDREKIINTNTQNVANERYFYRTEELNENDILNLNRLLIENTHFAAQEVNRQWIELFKSPFKEIKQISKNGGDPKKIAEIIKFFENNLHEEIHTRIENVGSKYLKLLLRKDISFFENVQEKLPFLQFLCFQYTRTNKYQNEYLIGIKKFPENGLEKIWSPISILLANLMAWGIFSRNFGIILLENNTSIPFITGDQPVINTFVADKPNGEDVKRLELYYPISPKLGILLTKDIQDQGRKILKMDDSVWNLNEQIFKNSCRQIYSNREDILKKYKINK